MQGEGMARKVTKRIHKPQATEKQRNKLERMLGNSTSPAPARMSRYEQGTGNSARQKDGSGVKLDDDNRRANRGKRKQTNRTQEF